MLIEYSNTIYDKSRFASSKAGYAIFSIFFLHIFLLSARNPIIIKPNPKVKIVIIMI